MAVPPQSQDGFLREVDEELRRDQAEQFFRRHGRAIIILVLLALLVLGGVLYWRHHQAQQAGVQGETLAAALSDIGRNRETDARTKLMALSADGSDGYRAAARLTLADLDMRKGDLKAAAQKFSAMAGDTSLPQAYRDLALVRQTAAEYDTLPPAQVIARLQRLAVAGNPWFGSAGEMVAIAHLRAGDRAKAGPLFAAIARDEGVPQTIRSRAVQIAGVMGIDALPATPGATTAGGTK